MALPFARSERSLEKDDYRTALISGVVTLPLFVAWLVWFFAGDLPIYQISEQLAMGAQDTLVADFTLDNIQNPHEVLETLRKAVLKARRKHNFSYRQEM